MLDFGILPDNQAEFEAAFVKAQAQADLVITSGGVSVGEADFTKTVLEKVGQVNFWKIAMKPGKPFAFGRIRKCLVLRFTWQSRFCISDILSISATGYCQIKR